MDEVARPFVHTQLILCGLEFVVRRICAVSAPPAIFSRPVTTTSGLTGTPNNVLKPSSKCDFENLKIGLIRCILTQS